MSELSVEELEAIYDLKCEYENNRLLDSDIILELNTGKIILNLIENLQKELEKYKSGYELLQAGLDNYISKDKIKEKIEWLDKLELLEEVDYSRIKFATDILKKILKEEQWY